MIAETLNGLRDISEVQVPWQFPVSEDFHVITYRDGFPVTEGHLLFVPRYNSVGVLSDAFEDAVRYGTRKVQSGEWDGFNVGMNFGEAAGQTVDWPHIHLIPRRSGDVDNPRGGVRNIIPGAGDYTETQELAW
jgi:diadenosine tetraphosphate (Ap4A) HIT family hydrolase